MPDDHMQHPMRCVRVHDLLCMEELLPYFEVEARGMHVEPEATDVVHLVSHQWLGNFEPDPERTHLHCLQAVFNRILGGQAEELFDEDDWLPFVQGTSVGSCAEVAELESEACQSVVHTADNVSKDIRHGIFWMDYLSIPQLDHARTATVDNPSDSATATRGNFLKRSASTDEVCAEQAKAINSIPAYVERCNYFWICAPRTRHVDTGVICDFNSWRSRGWCRLEEWTNALASRRKMPILITEAPKLVTVGAVDFILSQLGRPEKAACSGQFSCCRLEHRIGTRVIPCDKEVVGDVLQRLCDGKLQKLRSSGQMMMYGLLLCLRRTVLAAYHTEELPQAVETIDEFLARIGYGDLEDVNEIGDTPLHWAAFLGNADLVVRLLHARPELLEQSNHAGLSPLTLGVYRPDDQFPRILDFALSAVDASAPGRINSIGSCSKSGITILHRAASGGFAVHAEELLRRRADVNARRCDNGFTPLMSAAHAGYSACCEVLIRHRADVNACSKPGETPLHLAANPVSLLGNAEPSAKLRVLDVLLSARADPLALSSDGRTALQIAMERRFDAFCIRLGVAPSEEQGAVFDTCEMRQDLSQALSALVKPDQLLCFEFV
jgi:ankyrin repeat protein